ncbi:MAG TPA: NAD(+)/NADH kinase, partial [Candidatus Krumholzibacteria bacterium]
MRATLSTAARRGTHVGLIGNIEKEATPSIIRELIPLLVPHQLKVSLDEDLRAEARGTACTVGITDDCDVIIAVGGDGTILKVAGVYLDRDIP